MTTYSFFLITLAFLGIITIAQGIRIVPQGSVWTVERWGRYTRSLQPGLHIITPFVERVGHKVNIKEQVLDIQPSHAITKDNVLMIVDCTAFYKINDPKLSAYEIDDLTSGIENLVVNNIRTVLGAMKMDEALSQRDKINMELQKIVGAAMAAWGTTPTRIEIRDLSMPKEIQDAMSRIATAERTKKADITLAEGFKQAEILRAEGEKSAIELKAQALKAKTILEAEGEKQETILIAEARVKEAQAEAEAVGLVSKSISDGNPQALTYFLGQKYTESLQSIASAENSKLIFMPLEAANLIGSVGSITELVKDGISLPSGK
jgi:regulator of protease activity HflC (stomatin/prohibitin superfamily)